MKKRNGSRTVGGDRRKSSDVQREYKRMSGGKGKRGEVTRRTSRGGGTTRGTEGNKGTAEDEARERDNARRDLETDNISTSIANLG